MSTNLDEFDAEIADLEARGLIEVYFDAEGVTRVRLTEAAEEVVRLVEEERSAS